MFPARLHAARSTEQARTIVGRRKAAIVDDPAQNVATAKFEICRTQAPQGHRIVSTPVDSTHHTAAKVRLPIIDIAVAQPERTVWIAVDAATENGISACNAAVDDGLRADLRDGAFQLDVPPVD